MKHVKKMAEEFRISIRNHRRQTVEQLKGMEKEKQITQDDLKHSQEKVQKMTDEFISRVDKLLKE